MRRNSQAKNILCGRWKDDDDDDDTVERETKNSEKGAKEK